MHGRDIGIKNDNDYTLLALNTLCSNLQGMWEYKGDSHEYHFISSEFSPYAEPGLRLHYLIQTQTGVSSSYKSLDSISQQGFIIIKYSEADISNASLISQKIKEIKKEELINNIKARSEVTEQAKVEALVQVLNTLFDNFQFLGDIYQNQMLNRINWCNDGSDVLLDYAVGGDARSNELLFKSLLGYLDLEVNAVPPPLYEKIPEGLVVTNFKFPTEILFRSLPVLTLLKKELDKPPSKTLSNTLTLIAGASGAVMLGIAVSIGSLGVAIAGGVFLLGSLIKALWDYCAKRSFEGPRLFSRSIGSDFNSQNAAASARRGAFAP